ncbi:MAG: hypothetical protein HUJ31_10075 [Pseudomonadales bacterium]|nr:hypothetical protein [Pseudomonadales bacterium]
MRIPALLVIFLLTCGSCRADFQGQADNEDPDINGMMTYPDVDSAVLVFHDTRRNTEFMIGYSEDIDPRFLVVELDGKDISHLFDPKPTSLETVQLPIVEGVSKKLTLRIPQRLPEDSAATPLWDYDEFVIRADRGESLMMFPGGTDPADMSRESAIFVSPAAGEEGQDPR